MRTICDLEKAHGQLLFWPGMRVKRRQPALPAGAVGRARHQRGDVRGRACRGPGFGLGRLWADALDFAGDAANYAISLVALSMGLMWRARVAMLKGLTMAAFGVVVVARSALAFYHGVPPEAMTMGLVGALALLANLVTAVMLFSFREGDANMRSVWLCSRNDAIGNWP